MFVECENFKGKRKGIGIKFARENEELPCKDARKVRFTFHYKLFYLP